MELLIILLIFFGFTMLGAVTQNPVTGRTKNKYGPAVFSKWKDKNTMRTKPVQVANPNTVAQQNARAKFSYMSKLARDMGSWLDYGWDSFYSSMTRRNAYLKTNIENVTSAAGVVTAFDFNAATARTGRNPQTGATIQIAAKLTSIEITPAAGYPVAYDQGNLDVVVFNTETLAIIAVGSFSNPEASEMVVINYFPDVTLTVGDNVQVQYSWVSHINSDVDAAQQITGVAAA